MKTFLLIEASLSYSFNFLSKIILLNMNEEPNTNIIISCCKKTKKLIKNFPYKFKLSFHFLDCKLNKIDHSNYVLGYYNLLIDSLKYAVTNFGSVIYLYNDIYILRKFPEISNDIINQGYAFNLKKLQGHTEEITEKIKYALDVIYVNNIEFLDNLLFLLESSDKLSEMAYDYVKKYNTEFFFNEKTCISSHDFFSFEDAIKLTDISNDFILDDDEIYSINIDSYANQAPIVKLNSALLTKMNIYDSVFSDIYCLENKNARFVLTIPNKNGIGIWDRKKYNSGLYELFDMFHEIYPELCNIKETSSDFFSINKFALIDIPDEKFMHRQIMNFKEVILCNFNDSITSLLDEYDINYSFLLIYSDYPRKLDEFLKKNKKIMVAKERTKLTAIISYGSTREHILINDNEYILEDAMEELLDVVGIYIDKESFDCNMCILSCICGCVIVKGSNSTYTNKSNIFNYLKNNYHYINEDKFNKLTNKSKFPKFLANYYTKYISPKAVFKNLVNKLFVRNVE
jgi:hypothetical protein